MKAALVTRFGDAPHCREVTDPAGESADMVLEVLASALSQRVRSQADGSHYTSDAQLPLIPGVDGVGRDPDGRLRYFVTPTGAMAEYALVDPRRSVVLDDNADPVAVAAAMNPAMSSWIALRRRIPFVPGSRVLVLGATGHSGGLAVRVARHLGAGHVTAAGRNAERLAALADDGADATVRLGLDDTAAQLARVGAEVDVVLDYLWGEPTASALRAIVPVRDDDHPLTWIQIGSSGGQECAIPSAALRATKLQLVGSGQGSVSPRDILAELPELAHQITAGRFTVRSRTVPLNEVERAWAEFPHSSERIVIVP